MPLPPWCCCINENGEAVLSFRPAHAAAPRALAGVGLALLLADWMLLGDVMWNIMDMDTRAPASCVVWVMESG